MLRPITYQRKRKTVQFSVCSLACHIDGVPEASRTLTMLVGRRDVTSQGVGAEDDHFPLTLIPIGRSHVLSIVEGMPRAYDDAKYHHLKRGSHAEQAILCGCF